MMTPLIATLPKVEGVTFTIPEAAEGIVTIDAFSQLLGRVGTMPEPDSILLAERSAPGGDEAVMLPAAMVAAVARLRAAGESMPANPPSKGEAESEGGPSEDAQFLPVPVANAAAHASLPQPVPVLTLAPASAAPAVHVPASQVPATAAPVVGRPAAVEIPVAALVKDTESVSGPLQPDFIAARAEPTISRPVHRMFLADAPVPVSADEEVAAPLAAVAKPLAAPSQIPVVAQIVGEASAAAHPAIGATGTTEQTIEQTILQQLDLAHEGEWLDRLASDIARTAGKEGSLRFRLHPESLGSLHVEMTQGAAGASIRLTADSEAARAIIADAQPRLVAEARAQGVRIAETHVDLGGGGHWSSGEQRGQRGAPEQLLRTSGADSGEKVSAPEPNRLATERYA